MATEGVLKHDRESTKEVPLHTELVWSFYTIIIYKDNSPNHHLLVVVSHIQLHFLVLHQVPAKKQWQNTALGCSITVV